MGSEPDVPGKSGGGAHQRDSDAKLNLLGLLAELFLEANGGGARQGK
jgi:hypothetical protein